MSDADSQQEEVVADLSNPDVVTKYKAAADIANKAIAHVIDLCKDGAKVVDVCTAGDALITKEVGSIFKGKQIEKGSAFPTCVSVNSIVGHFSPQGDDTTALKDGDVVKIDLGCHIDGFIATQATTIVVGAAQPITGKPADVIAAARAAFNAAVRLIRPGKHVSDVAPTLQKIAEAYGCNVVEGVMSHEMKQYIIDGTKCVLNKPTPEHKVEDVEFEENEVYAIDIVVSSGEGKPKVLDEKETTVYKRALETAYQLKLKASRAVFTEINSNFPTMPFTIRALVGNVADKNGLKASELRLGLVECLNHGLLHPYPVLHEKPDAIVAQIKGTVLLMPNGSNIITKAPEHTKVESDKKIEDQEVLDLLATSVSAKSSKKKKAPKAVEPPAAEAPAS